MQIYGQNILNLDFVNNLAMVNGEDYAVDRNVDSRRQNAFDQYGGPLSFTRGTHATVTDSTGRLTYAPNNLLTYSEQFDNAAWTKVGGASVSADTIVAPNGTITADTLTGTGTGSGLLCSTASPVGTSIISVYVQKGTVTSVRVQATNGGNGYSSTFDMNAGTAGTITTIGTGGNITSVSAGITSIGSNWYRCFIVLTATGPNTIGFYGGNGTVYLWGAQLEQVTYQTTPRAYIPTTSAAYYGPRFDYDPVALTPKGLLIEEQRTNLLTNSDQLVAGIGTTISPNVVISPDGTTNADKLVEDTSNGAHWTLKSVSITSGQVYTYSVYLKAAERNVVNIFTSGSLGGASARINLLDGSVSNLVGMTPIVTNVGSGWYMVSYTVTASSTTTGGVYVGLSNAGAGSYQGDGTSGAFVWGQQFEAGTFATSYIPTAASTVTRNSDNCSITGSNFANFFNQNQGTFATNSNTDRTTGYGSVLSAAVDTNNRIDIGVLGTSGYQDVVAFGRETATFPNYNAPNVSQYASSVFTRATIAYQVNNCNVAVNGAAGTATTVSAIPIPTQLLIGSDLSSRYLNGRIRSLQYYPQRLPNATLQSLTQPTATTTLSLDFVNQNYTVGL